MTKDELIELINHTVYENENGDITGEVMNMVLNAIVATMGVEANPDDEATGTLNKIKIGEEVFDVEGGGSSNYNDLSNKPSINNVTLTGNKTAEQLGLQPTLTLDATPTEDSTNPVQSGGVYEALETLIPRSSLFGGFITDEATPNPGDIRRYFLTNLSGELPNFDYVNLPDNGKWKIVRWNPRDAGWDYETIDCYTSDKIDYALDIIATALSNKQNTITDLAEIRSGAAAGATAYQKPSGGIPASDLAAAVQTSLGKADTALQSYTETDPIFQASPAAGITSGDIADWDGKADTIPVVDASTIPASMDADKVYQYGTLSGETTFPALATPTDLTVAHVYCWTFSTPSTAPTITWPSGITSWAGGSAPTINASKSYEVSVMDGLATIIEA